MIAQRPHLGSPTLFVVCIKYECITTSALGLVIVTTMKSGGLPRVRGRNGASACAVQQAARRRGRDTEGSEAKLSVPKWIVGRRAFHLDPRYQAPSPSLTGPDVA